MLKLKSVAVITIVGIQVFTSYLFGNTTPFTTTEWLLIWIVYWLAGISLDIYINSEPK